MGGTDGNVTELEYKTINWLTSCKKYKRERRSENLVSAMLPRFLKNLNSDRVKQLCVDESRGLLYALIESDSSQTIAVYDLEEDCRGFKRILKIRSRVLV